VIVKYLRSGKIYNEYLKELKTLSSGVARLNKHTPAMPEGERIILKTLGIICNSVIVLGILLNVVFSTKL